jgi:glycosyltransferase involved in cell wall biosynthesis
MEVNEHSSHTSCDSLAHQTMAPNPLVTFLLLAYNQEQYIRTAVEGAFSQDYSPMEIILSDDCSKDRTFDIIKEMAAAYRGPHKIILNRNERNLGIGRHFNRVMELAGGDIVELSAGDDISLPWRTSDSVAVLNDNPKLTCVSLGLYCFTNDTDITPIRRAMPGPLTEWSLTDFLQTPGFFVNAPARAFRKYTHDLYGSLIPECPVEDGSNLFRCLLHGNAATSESPAVLYRWNGNNVSSPANLRMLHFSGIYGDFLNTIRIATNRGDISESLSLHLTETFVAKRNKALLMEQVRSGNLNLKKLKSITAADQLSSLEKVKILIKLVLCSVGVNRWLP